MVCIYKTISCTDMKVVEHAAIRSVVFPPPPKALLLIAYAKCMASSLRVISSNNNA